MTLTKNASGIAQAQLESLLQTAVDGIIVIDEHGSVLRFNAACERIFGYSSNEVIGQNVGMLMAVDIATMHGRYISSYVTTGEKHIIDLGREVKGRMKSGDEVPIHLSVAEAQTESGRQFIGIMRDLRLRKAYEARIQNLQDELIYLTRIATVNEIGSILAHELNQPITALMLYGQACKTQAEHETGLSEQFKSTILKLSHEAERIGSIVQRMRRMVQKEMPLRKETPIHETIDDALALVFPGNSYPIKLVRNYDAAVPDVNIDEIQIQQILINLLRNAQQALSSTSKPKITIKTYLQDQNLIIDVIDNGVGLTKSQIETLFQPFQTTKLKGIGIGLAISKTIAQSHGGDLIVSSAGPSKGACFSIQLPLV